MKLTTKIASLLFCGVMFHSPSFADDFFPETGNTFFERSTYHTISKEQKEVLSFSEWWRHVKLIAQERGVRISDGEVEYFRKYYNKEYTPYRAYREYVK